MSSDDLAAHRSRIGFEVERVLLGYWQTDIEPVMKAAVLADWADELEDWSVDQVRWALRAWRRDNSRRKPNPGDILLILKRRRGVAAAERMGASAQAGALQEVRVTDEERARNLAVVQRLFPKVVGHMSGKASDG